MDCSKRNEELRIVSYTFGLAMIKKELPFTEMRTAGRVVLPDFGSVKFELSISHPTR